MAIPASGRNLTVIARNEADGFYYSGFITSFKGDKDGISDKYLVHFHSIRPKEVQRNHIIVVGGATPWPELKVRDYVLTKVWCQTAMTECFVPGIVVVTPLDLHVKHRFFAVRLHNGQITSKQRACIVKIGPEKYKNIMEYIASIRYPASMLNNRGLKLLIWYCSNAEHSDKHTQTDPRSPRPRSSATSSVRSSSSSERRSKRSDKHTQTDPRSPRPRSSATSSVVGVKEKIAARTTPIKKDTVVLARWLDDGWFYFGRIATEPDIYAEEEVYTVVDAIEHSELVNREDILTEEGRLFDAVQPHDPVIALHPDYIYSYAPATVTEVYDQGVQVHFFDDKERKLPLSEVYKITSRKYKKYVAYIGERMNKLTGKVIARDDTAGIYEICIAEDPDPKAQQVYLKSPINKKQLAIHVFPKEKLIPNNEQAGQYVLAQSHILDTAYIPARRVTSTNRVRLPFYDGTTTGEAESNQCILINERYYKNAAQYLMNIQKKE